MQKPSDRMDFENINAAILAGGDDATQAREKLVLGSSVLVRKMARRYAFNEDVMDDLVQEGMLGLLKAARKFDPSKEVHFFTYATWWIKKYMDRWAMRNGRRLSASYKRVKESRDMARWTRTFEAGHGRAPTMDELATALALSPEQIRDLQALSLHHNPPADNGYSEDLGHPFAIDPHSGPEAQVIASQRMELFRLAIQKITEAPSSLPARQTLTQNERALLEHLLGEDEGSSAEFARTHGITRQAVSQRLIRVRAKLTAHLQKELGIDSPHTL
jgi:RNA polymerase sigma factor (sigma-70 family)